MTPNSSAERYQITKDTAFDLAALALQADMGDYYDRTGNQYFDPYSYVPPDVSPSLDGSSYLNLSLFVFHSRKIANCCSSPSQFTFAFRDYTTLTVDCRRYRYYFNHLN